MQRVGLEWLWRIKEEPYLWRRYWNDGRVLLRLLRSHILPLVIYRLQLENRRDSQNLFVKQTSNNECITVSISGSAIARHVNKVIPIFRDAITTKKPIMIDFSETRAIDARFLGLLLMLRKKLKGSVAGPILIGLSPGLKRIFRLNGLGFLLAPDKII
jgi:N-acetylglucosaminyldiphosphoundecaprenol N-acetyl-beta-D-mannosaminyltransferase